MAHTNNGRCEQHNKEQRKISKSGQIEPTMDNSSSNRSEPEHTVQAGRDSVEYASQGKTVADSGSARNEAGISGPDQRNEGAAGIIDYGSDEYRFPAGQGAYQYPWEEPRTIESSMVYTIDGHNFTEDLHRAIGNSVVEHTAEIAFIDLMRKHKINIK